MIAWILGTLKLLYVIWLVGTLWYYMKLEHENGEDADYVKCFVKWIWLQVFVHLLPLSWVAVVQDWMEYAFERMG